MTKAIEALEPRRLLSAAFVVDAVATVPLQTGAEATDTMSIRTASLQRAAAAPIDVTGAFDGTYFNKRFGTGGEASVVVGSQVGKSFAANLDFDGRSTFGSGTVKKRSLKWSGTGFDADTGEGIRVRASGKLSPDGQTITGKYKLQIGKEKSSGTFVVRRA